MSSEASSVPAPAAGAGAGSMVSPAAEAVTGLGLLRERIDEVDRELLALLNRRAALALEVGEVKKTEGSPVFRPEREAQVIDNLKARNPGLEQKQREGRAIWWDKDLDRDELKRQQAARVPQQGYVYQTSTRKD